MASPKETTLFEVSWEVCNKVGGIHTVVSSKAPFLAGAYKEYITIGPRIQDGNAEFEPRPVPAAWAEVFAVLERDGIHCRFGIWSIAGEPIAILIDSSGLMPRKDGIKSGMWERFRIDSLNAAWEFDEPMCFSTAAGMLVEEYLRRHPGPAVLQAHEWMAGFSILHCKMQGVQVGTVFTTHATMLGRTIAGNGHDLYAMLPTVNPAEWAYRLGVQDKHTAEVACAKYADVFTTVSEITGMEAEKLLGRKPDVLLFNGFHTDRFPTFEETSIRHVKSRNALRDLVSALFLPSYVIDTERTIFFFTSGRYEFQNKGIDVLIEALGELNNLLKAEKCETTVVVLFWVIMGRRGVQAEVIERHQFFTQIKSHVEWHSKPLLQRIALDLASGRKPTDDNVFTGKFLEELQGGVRAFRGHGAPPIVTHELTNPAQDPILAACQRAGLDNEQEDVVKFILYPGYLDGNDGLLDLHYYDATAGAHLGIFPSAYEPWGYTPLESAVLGVPAITTDLAGFGRYIDSRCRTDQEHNAGKGIFVLRRMGTPRAEVVKQLVERLRWYVALDHMGRVRQGFAAKDLSALCDWKEFLPYYLAAHRMALERSAKTP